VSERTDANEARYDRMAGSYRLLTRLASLGTIGRLYRAAAGALEASSSSSASWTSASAACREASTRW
jgi:hypothetical protein